MCKRSSLAKFHRLYLAGSVAATDRVLEQCIDNPNDKLLAVFEKARKG